MLVERRFLLLVWGICILPALANAECSQFSSCLACTGQLEGCIWCSSSPTDPTGYFGVCRAADDLCPDTTPYGPWSAPTSCPDYDVCGIQNSIAQCLQTNQCMWCKNSSGSSSGLCTTTSNISCSGYDDYFRGIACCNKFVCDQPFNCAGEQKCCPAATTPKVEIGEGTTCVCACIGAVETCPLPTLAPSTDPTPSVPPTPPTQTPEPPSTTTPPTTAAPTTALPTEGPSPTSPTEGPPPSSPTTAPTPSTPGSSEEQNDEKYETAVLTAIIFGSLILVSLVIFAVSQISCGMRKAPKPPTQQPTEQTPLYPDASVHRLQPAVN